MITEVFPDLVFLQFAFSFDVSYGGKGTAIRRLIYTALEGEGVAGWTRGRLIRCVHVLSSCVRLLRRLDLIAPQGSPSNLGMDFVESK
ncbi:hypothetical protein E1B28_012912 [Marasmius oreades]|uniref:Uncharacterized protein n=1 Tax=Marasmius oreades TaxID=181124 RepID=A0A9P7UNR9_9AGAR|nr:uncharacterized protein E1B28_012912 [Marasmius oreades]KAG7088967.1 hypothetical protein E1B28_012912 [Marasmius oreades]